MKRALLLTVIAIAICLGTTAVAAGAPTAPYSANADCLFCHDLSTGSGAVSKVEFDVSPAMLARCASCHYQPYHWSHYNDNTCAGCHPQRPAVYQLYGRPTYPSSGGYFQSAASLTRSPQELHQIHANGSTWQNDVDDIDGTVCGTCHKPAACAACHGSDPDAATHTAHAQGNAAYPPVTYTQATGWGMVTTSSTCVNPSCHALAKATTAGFVPTCASCHPARVNDHGYEEGQHTADVTSTVDGGGKTCGDCHKMALYAEHGRTSASSAASGCGACHPTPRSSFGAWNQTCSQGGCHATGSATEAHTGEAGDHAALTTGAAAVCSDCHAGSLDVVHAEATSTVDPARTSCLVCHSTSSVPATKDCTTCHFTYDAHPYPVDQHLSDSTLANCGGPGCHSTRDLLGAHLEKNAAYDCTDCHGSTRPEVQTAIANGLTACSDCHLGVSETQAHYTQHEASPPLIGGAPDYAPNYAFFTGSATGGLFTSDCAGCHATNLIDAHVGGSGRAPQFDSTGSPLTCDTCHASTDPRVIAAIAAGPAVGETKCDACHVNPLTGGDGVHGPINATHTSTFKANPEVKCSPCHDANIVDQHNGGAAWPDANGKQLVGCDVCHKNFAGTRSQQVQAAIDPLNDTKCTACHAASHPDFNSHEATTAASLECGVCHAKGQATVDVKAVHENASIGPCAVCHDNTGRVADIRNETAECASCHSAQGTDFHRDFASAHVAPASQSCTDCHETNVATTLHAAVGDGCLVCHDNPAVPTLPATTACVNCHSDESPADPDHYTGTEGTHTAANATQYGYACSACHKLEMKPEHVKPSSGNVTCVECHELKVDNLSGAWDKTCAQCHGAQHGAYDSAHMSTQSACAGSGCHLVADVRTVHSDATTSVAGVTLTSCQVCHQNSDTLPPSTNCNDCHEGHGDITEKHAAKTSGDCTSCHETGDVRTIHVGSAKGECDVCHDNPDVVTLPASVECVNCHSDESPADPDHYTGTESTHTATNGTESGFACSQCHKLEMKPEHDKVTSGSVTCVTCHETKVDAFTSAWNKTCAACHSVKHGGITTAHDATGIGNANECGGAGCHEITDLRAIHANSIPGNATTMGDASCATASCHTSDSTIPSKKSCDSVGCHAGTQPHKHELNQAGSVYISDAAGGCTAAGAGCHGAAPDPSYATYHPASGCTTGACHTAANHNATQFNDPNTCQNCHGGGATIYAGAPNVSSLLGSSPSGHYVDSKHAPAVNDASMLGATGGTVVGYCRDCHNPSNSTGPDGLYVQHSGVAAWSGKICSECHNDSSAVTAVVSSDWSTGLCIECHTSSVLSSASQHSTSTAPTVTATEAQGSGTCVTSGCHQTLDLHVLHKGSASTPAGSELRTQGCAAGDCHDYTKQAAKPNKKSCGTGGGCHTSDPHDPTAHDSLSSSECLGCHEGANNTATVDIRAIVRTGGSAVHSCATCHNSGSNLSASNTAECVDCHNGTDAGTHAYTPVDPNHYVDAAHAANADTESPGVACSQCHYLGMKPEHAKASSGAVTCVQCHETKVDAFASAWDKSCTRCHPTKHMQVTQDHTSSKTDCGGAGCHNIANVADIHDALPNYGCDKCHTGPAALPTTTDCNSAGCHPGATGDHEAQHDTAGVIDAGCYGCHFQYLTDEHLALGMTCDTCHSSANSVVSGAITARDRACLTCHPDSAHNARQESEFAEGNASMHRVRDDLPGMRSSFVVNGSTYTWSLPTASSFLKAGYTTTSIVTCNMCHSYSGTTGPHGATMKVNIDPAYPNSYNDVGGSSATAQLSRNSSTGMSRSANGSTTAKIICEKCHDLNGTSGTFSNAAHSEHDDRGSDGAYCVQCHVSIPHGWGRPRLIGYTTDAAPYRTTTGGISRISLKSYTPNGWNRSDCGAGCSSGRHPLSGSSWPNVMGAAAKPGSVSGKVTAAAGGASISGASVTLGTVGSATTAADGTYAITGVPAGSYTMTVTRSGYSTWSGSVTVTGGATTTQNVSLSTAPVNLALNKTVTQSSQYSSTYSGAKAVDGSASTYWRSSSSGTQWIVVDLGSTQSIKKFDLDWNSFNYARSYRIETAGSSSGPWTQQFSQSSSSTGDRTVTLANVVSARYVRVYCTSANQSSYQIAEFQVWDQ